MSPVLCVDTTASHIRPISLYNFDYKIFSAVQSNTFMWIDFSKAFDSISHGFLFTLLKHIDFPESMINSLRNTMNQASTRILFNKSLSLNSIPIRRGSRQGDPISGYLH
eukprot:TRINITY_DN5017_c0_g2_i11.p2 TRINITY_DN5017_c0_g2~~TRINITY_DN5017_c0_g2_i11.p2  ORF type:complete len:109 (+),score=2.55 TRINITY_DN5017_c0_g2_i11:648-974(+)